MKASTSSIAVRLRSQNGFTIGEVLVTVILVGLLTMAIAAGIGAALKAYSSVKQYSEAQAVFNNAVTAVTDELRFSYDVSPVSGTAPGTDAGVQAVAFNSTVRNARIYLGNGASAADDRQVITMYGVTAQGSTYSPQEPNPSVDGASGDSAPLPLVNTSANGTETSNFTAKLTELSWNEDSRTWTFGIEVTDGSYTISTGNSSETGTGASGHLTVRSVNTW